MSSSHQQSPGNSVGGSASAPWPGGGKALLPELEKVSCPRLIFPVVILCQLPEKPRLRMAAPLHEKLFFYPECSLTTKTVISLWLILAAPLPSAPWCLCPRRQNCARHRLLLSVSEGLAMQIQFSWILIHEGCCLPSAWKHPPDAKQPWCMHAKSLQSYPTLWSPWTGAWPGSMEFYRQEYWSGSPWPHPGDHPDPGIFLTHVSGTSYIGRQVHYH